MKFKKGQVFEKKMSYDQKATNLLEKSCLIVDDNETSCKILKSMVQKLNYSVNVVHTVDDAHKYLETNQ